MVVGKLNKPGSVRGKRMHAMGVRTAWVGVVCFLALILCASADSTATSELLINGETSELLNNGESIPREVKSHRNWSTFRDPRKSIIAHDTWIYRAFGRGNDNYPIDPPKFELSWALVMGSLIAILGSALGSIGGVGGGGFYLPMLNVVMRFSSTASVALSKAMVMGVAISAVIFNLKTKHPTEARAVINYQFALLFQPMILLGISAGVIFNTLLPDWVVTLFLVVLLTKMVISTLNKANELAAQEKRTRQENLRNDAINCGSQESENGDYVEILSNGNGGQEKVTWQWFPRKPLVVLHLTWFTFLALQIIKTMAPQCSFLFWLATLSQVPLAFGVTIWEAFKSPFAIPDGPSEEIPLNIKPASAQKRGIRNLILSLLGLLAGVAGGLLGLGGGGVLGPGFLELGLSPQEASSTASFIMVFSSSLSVVEYSLLGQLPKTFAIYFISVSVVSAIFGQAVIKKIVHASGRISIIVYALVVCIAAGDVTLGILGVITSVEQLEAGANMGLQKFCPSQ